MWKPLQETDFIWKNFWLLTIIWFERMVWSRRLLKCKCDCWNYFTAYWTQIRMWSNKSCWCLRKKSFWKHSITHWFTWKRFFMIYNWLKSRCNNNHNKNYWWRWIKCLWNKFEEFKNDMYESYLEHCKEYWEKQTTIDRIDVNWNYSKENCRWATYNEQNNNSRNNKHVSFNWEKITIKQFCNKTWLWYNIVYKRLLRWRDINKIISK